MKKKKKKAKSGSPETTEPVASSSKVPSPPEVTTREGDKTEPVDENTTEKVVDAPAAAVVTPAVSSLAAVGA